MGKKAACALFTALILLVCLVPSAGMLLPREADTGGNETLAALPGIYDRQGRLNTQYLSQLQRYAEDNHYLRQRMITLWSELNVRYLGTSIAEDVVLGRDGWLYFGDTLPDYAGTDPMTEREVFSAARNLALAQEYCESRGAEFLFTVAPNKNSLYPERMPGITPAAGPGNAERLGGRLLSGPLRPLPGAGGDAVLRLGLPLERPGSGSGGGRGERRAGPDHPVL